MKREDLIQVVRVRHGVEASRIVAGMLELVSEEDLREFFGLMTRLLDLAVAGYVTSRPVSASLLQEFSDKAWQYYKADEGDELPFEGVLDILEEVLDEAFVDCVA